MTRAPQSCQEILLEQMSGGALARMRPDLGTGALAPRRAAASGWRQPGSLAHSRRLGDNAGMARDDSGDRLLRRLVFMSLLDGTRPSGTLEWVSPVTPVVTQAAVGAGHWAAGRRQRALAAWASAAGFGLVAWGLGTEAPTRAEVQQYIEQQKDLLRKRGLEVPLPPRRPRPASDRRSPLLPCFLGRGDGPRRAVGPAQPAAADGARDRQRSPDHLGPCPAGAPGRAAAQAEDRRRLSPGRSRIGGPAVGGGG